MMCAWKQLLEILPDWLAIDTDRYGKQELQELRLRHGQVPELKLGYQSLWLERIVTRDDLHLIVNMASRYSPWAAETLAEGFLTASGGHRIGVCGEAVIKEGRMSGFRQIDSMCIRVARDYPGISENAAKLSGSVLVIGPPGAGKTTLLRDIARSIAKQETVCVIDERRELFPAGVARGRRMDVITGCGKPEGIEMALRTMGPDCITVDEITSDDDCAAMVRAGWCGVRLLASAHAASVFDLKKRPVYKPLMDCGLFDHILVLDRDKSWREERLAG